MAREKAELERDRALIAMHYLDGLTQSQIAAKIKMNQSTVSRDLKIIQKRWIENTTLNIDKHKLKDLNMLDKMLDELWKAWDTSTKYEKVRRKGMTVLVPLDVVNPLGNPRYMEQIQKCIIQRRAIIGIDAPIKHDHGVDLRDITVSIGKKK